MTGIEYEKYVRTLVTTHVIPSLGYTLQSAIKGTVHCQTNEFICLPCLLRKSLKALSR